LVQNKKLGTPEHIRRVEALMKDFKSLQIDERKQTTLYGFLKRE
jgi:hypothetical protein